MAQVRRHSPKVGSRLALFCSYNDSNRNESKLLAESNITTYRLLGSESLGHEMQPK